MAAKKNGRKRSTPRRKSKTIQDIFSQPVWENIANDFKSATEKIERIVWANTSKELPQSTYHHLAEVNECLSFVQKYKHTIQLKYKEVFQVAYNDNALQPEYSEAFIEGRKLLDISGEANIWSGLLKSFPPAIKFFDAVKSFYASNDKFGKKWERNYGVEYPKCEAEWEALANLLGFGVPENYDMDCFIRKIEYKLRENINDAEQRPDNSKNNTSTVENTGQVEISKSISDSVIQAVKNELDNRDTKIFNDLVESLQSKVSDVVDDDKTEKTMNVGKPATKSSKKNNKSKITRRRRPKSSKAKRARIKTFLLEEKELDVYETLKSNPDLWTNGVTVTNKKDLNRVIRDLREFDGLDISEAPYKLQ